MLVFTKKIKIQLIMSLVKGEQIFEGIFETLEMLQSQFVTLSWFIIG